MGFITNGFTPSENSPIYRAPASVSRISLSRLVLLLVALITLPSFSSSFTFSNLVPAYSVGVLNCMVPFTDVFVGQENTSPSGTFRSPAQGIAGMPLMLKVRSVPGPTSLTSFALVMRLANGFIALAIRA